MELNSQSDTGQTFPTDSDDEVAPSPAFRVDRANHDKNLSSAGAIPIMPQKGSFQLLRAMSQKILPIYYKDAQAHTQAMASIDVEEIPDVMQLNSQDESSDTGSKRQTETRSIPEASLEAEVTEADDQKGESSQNRAKLQAADEQVQKQILVRENKFKKHVKNH
jgi:hypothetical protein